MSYRVLSVGPGTETEELDRFPALDEAIEDARSRALADVDGETSTLCQVGVATSGEDLFAACSTAEDAPIYVVRETEARS